MATRNSNIKPDAPALPDAARLLNMRAIQAALPLSRPSIYILINKGVLRTVRVGSRRFTTPDYLAQCISKLAAQSESEARRVLQTKRRRRAA